MSDQSERAKSIFLEAIERHAPEQWPAFVEQACAGDAAVRAEVERLLSARADLGSFHEAQRPEPVRTVDLAAERPGESVGPYKLVQEIGEGGMGTVFLAQQTEPVKRLVALKVIKPGMDSRPVLARFEAERQALALMDHPNIATVLDAGTAPSGRPYFVMELVKGVPITKYCDDHRLGVRDRLALFADVCRAVQHAHMKGIIHRDLKPSNVLVAPYDGRPVVKVIDFGVAKAAGQPLTERTLVTGFGAVVGTPEYMSPEQAELNNADIDTRSDVYSLGVLLYELLAGSPPFARKDLEKAGMIEMLRVIREQEPSRPSHKLSTADGLPTLAANRGTEPAKLTKLVKGELDWIVMKALEKDRSRRYETANGFAADVQRYLADEPVQACPPSVGYRLRKFARRNRGGLAVAALVLSFMVLLGSAIGWAVRDRTARQTAIEQEVNLALKEAEQWKQDEKWPEALSAIKRAEGLLAGSGSNELRERVRQLRKDVEMVLRIEEIPLLYSEINEGKFDYASADRAYAKAFADYGIDVASMPAEEAAARIRSRPEVALALTAALDDWAFARGKVDKASGLALTALAQAADANPWRQQVRKAALHKDSKGLKALAASPDLLRQPSTTLLVLARALRAVDLVEAQIEVLRLAQRQYPGDFWINYSLAWNLGELSAPDRNEAVPFFRAALAVRPRNVAAHNSLGLALINQGKVDEAIACYQKAIDLDPKYAPAHNNLGIALRKQGKVDEAIACHQKAIELDAKSAHAHYSLGLTLYHQKKLDEAVTSYRKAIEIDPKSAVAHSWLGNALHVQKKVDEAIDAHRKAIDLDPKNGPNYYNLGLALKTQGKVDEAIACYQKAIELDPKFAPAHTRLGYILCDQKKLNEAITSHHKAIELDPTSADAHVGLGDALCRQKKFDEAIASFQKAIKLDPNSARGYNGLGTALENRGKHDEAIAAYRKATELDPKFDVAFLNLGGALSDQKKHDEAIAACRKAIELDPKDAEAYVQLSYVLYAQKKLDEAIAANRKAIEIDPENPRAYHNLGNALKAQGKPDEAIVAFRKAIELDPKDAKFHHNLGIALADQKKLNEAIACYRRAIELDPTIGAYHNDLGICLKHQGKLPEAIASYRKAIELDPKYAYAHNNLGLALYAQKKFDDAIVAFRKASELNPKDAWHQYNLGVVLRDQKKLDDAITAFRKAIELDPNHVDAHDNLGAALRAQGKLDDAIAVYRKAVELHPKNVKLRNNLGFALSAKGWILVNHTDTKLRDPKRAVELSKESVEFVPQSSEAWQYLGAVLYRASDWKASIEALEKSCKLQEGGTGDCGQWVLLALAHAQLAAQEGLTDGEREQHRAEARRLYEKADKQIDEWYPAAPTDPRAHPIWEFRQEARKLIGPKEEKK